MQPLKGRQTDVLISGPWSMVNDAVDSTTANTSTLYAAQNMYPDPQLGSWVGRPGSRPMGQTGGAGPGTQLGQSGHRRVQGSITWTKRNTNGTVTRYTVVVCGGKFYTYDWSLDTYTEVETAADFTAKSITLDKDSRVFFTVCGTQTGFAQLHVSDGVNVPFLWDGSTGGGTGAGLTKLTNSPVLYGQPWMYYAKVMGTMNANRGRTVWGEENDPTVGYLMPAYNNVWQDPGAQDANPLYGGIGTNDAIYLYRNRSTVSITGRLDTQFSTTGVRADVSNTVGVASSASLVFHEGTIFFQDADGRLRYQAGNTVNDTLWRESRQTTNTLNLGQLQVVQAVDYVPAGVILFGVPGPDQSDMSLLMAVSMTSGAPHFVGTWSGFGTFSCLAMALDQDGVPVLLRGDTNGYVYRFGDPNRVGSTQIWDDYSSAGVASPITHVLTPSYLGGNTDTERQFLRADAVFRADSNMTVGASYQTPRSTSNLLSTTIMGTGTLYGEALYGEFTYGGGTTEVHRAFGYGRNANGRWLLPSFTHQSVGEQFGMLAMSVDAVQVSRQPRTP